MGKKKVVLDTNIFISALGWFGKPHEIFSKITMNELDLVVSPEQIEELKEVMNYDKFAFTDNQKSRFLSSVTQVATLVEISGKLKVIEEDPDDDIVLETAAVGNADFIISGDEHLLKLEEYEGIKIVTAAEFVKLLR
jgi:uncharacterized protein